MSNHEQYDYGVIIIGGGSAGLACAREANKHGAKVLLVYYTKPTPKGTTWDIGGTCVNVGCTPKILMLEAALLGEAVHDATSYGWQIVNETSITLNWSQMIENIQSQIKSINLEIKAELDKNQIEYINGMASFVDEHTINIKLIDGTEVQHRAKFIVIAIGVRPIYPEIPGAQEYGITSDDLFSCPKPLGKILIVGAGYIGMEFSGFLRLFGFDVTIMARDKVLKTFDTQMTNIVIESLKERGIKFLIPNEPLAIKQQENGRLLIEYRNLETSIEGKEIFDTIIWASGRKGNLEDLNIKAVDLKVEDDLIVVNYEDRTNVVNIYAVGDIAKGRPQLTPVAIRIGRLLGKRLFSCCFETMNYENVASTLFTPIPYAFVGMSEEAAIEKFGEDNIEVYHKYHNPLEFSLPEKVIEFCYIKIIAQRESPRTILGIHFMGPNAGNVVQGFSVAHNCGLTIETLFNTVGNNVINAGEIAQAFITKRSGLDPSVNLYF